MNSKLICFFALIAAAYSVELVTVADPTLPLVAGVIPNYAYYGSLRPLGIYPEGVNPNDCPNYPICDTLDKPLIKSFYAPSIPFPGFASRFLVNL